MLGTCDAQWARGHTGGTERCVIPQCTKKRRVCAGSTGMSARDGRGNYKRKMSPVGFAVPVPHKRLCLY